MNSICMALGRFGAVYGQAQSHKNHAATDLLHSILFGLEPAGNNN